MLVERAGFGVDDDYSVDDDFILLDERPREREILFSPEPVVETVSDPSLDAESRESMERWGEKTCLSLPLRFGGATLGVLVVCETERERRFSEEEMELARGLANQASAAVHNARVYRDLEERNVELVARARRERLLNELSLELGASLDPRKVLDSACSRICAILDATGCEIWAHERRRHHRVPRRVGGRRGRRGVDRPPPAPGGLGGDPDGARGGQDAGRRLARRSPPGRGGARGDARVGPALVHRHAAACSRPHPGDAGDHAGRPRAGLHPRGGRDGRGLRAADGAWPSTTRPCTSARPTTPGGCSRCSRPAAPSRRRW